MKFILAILLFAAAVVAMPGNQWGGGGQETCSTEYITSTSVGWSPTTEYEVQTTWKVYTTSTEEECEETTLITTSIIKTYSTTIYSTWTSECEEVITSSYESSTWVPVTTSTEVVTTCPVPTSVPYTTSCVETETICCTQDQWGNQGPWTTKAVQGGW
jgi:hypothetical protein